MRKLKYALCGALAAIVAVCGLAAFAAANIMSIDVETGIEILVNGAVFKPKDATGKDAFVFVYDGTTYAPLRALAETYGLVVGYDEASNRATVDSPSGLPAAPKATAPPAVTPGVVVYDAHGVTVTYDGPVRDSFIFGLEFTIVNNSPDDIIVQSRGESIDGYMVNVFFYPDVLQGKTRAATMHISTPDLEKYGLTAPKTIEFELSIMSADTYTTLYESETITLDI